MSDEKCVRRENVLVGCVLNSSFIFCILTLQQRQSITLFIARLLYCTIYQYGQRYRTTIFWRSIWNKSLTTSTRAKDWPCMLHTFDALADGRFFCSLYCCSSAWIFAAEDAVKFENVVLHTHPRKERERERERDDWSRTYTHSLHDVTIRKKTK